MHPNCLCYAEPVLEGAGEADPPEITAEDALNLVSLLGALGAMLFPEISIPVALARAAQLGRLSRMVQRLTGRSSGARPRTDATLFKRPQGVPKEWVAKPARDGEGIVYEKPGAKGGSYVKIQKGNPDSSQPGQRYDNVRWTENGNSLDKDGNIVPRRSEESHIPVEDFKFKPELFK